MTNVENKDHPSSLCEELMKFSGMLLATKKQLSATFFFFLLQVTKASFKSKKWSKASIFEGHETFF